MAAYYPKLQFAAFIGIVFSVKANEPMTNSEARRVGRSPSNPMVTMYSL